MLHGLGVQILGFPYLLLPRVLLQIGERRGICLQRHIIVVVEGHLLLEEAAEAPAYALDNLHLEILRAEPVVMLLFNMDDELWSEAADCDCCNRIVGNPPLDTTTEDVGEEVLRQQIIEIFVRDQQDAFLSLIDVVVFGH